MEDLKVLPVRKLPEKDTLKLKRKLDPRLPGATKDGGFKPFLMVISAPVRSGKSNLIMSILYQDNLLRGVFKEIMFISPTLENDDTLWAIRKDDEVIKITENLEELDLILESIVELQKSKEKEKREHTLLVLDDTLGLIKAGRESYFSALCSKYRHFRLSLIITTQNFRALPPTCRYNATYYIIFKTNNRKELDKMYEELEGNFPFLDVYAEATHDKYNFLYLNMEDIKAYKNFNTLLYEKD